MFPNELFFDIYDGNFSNSLAEATAMTRELGVEGTYSAFSSLLEAHSIATEIVKREDLRFVATETYEMLMEDLREHFLDGAEELFKEFWKKSEAKGIGKSEEIKSRFKAIRVLKLARDQAVDEEQKVRLETRYKENVDRDDGSGRGYAPGRNHLARVGKAAGWHRCPAKKVKKIHLRVQP
jgi:hypothetical protein